LEQLDTDGRYEPQQQQQQTEWENLTITIYMIEQQLHSVLWPIAFYNSHISDPGDSIISIIQTRSYAVDELF
jgi:hypothetical protein